MTNSVINSTQNYQSELLNNKKLIADEIFKNLSKKIGTDATTANKNQVKSSINNLETDNSNKKNESNIEISTQSGNNWNKISNNMTGSDINAGINYIKAQKTAVTPSSSASNSLYFLAETYNSLRDKLGSSSIGITKNDLMSYLQKLTSSGTANGAEVAYIRNLINNFDNLSGGSDYITSLTGNSNNLSKEPQDPSTITAEQLKHPIDIRV